MKQLEWISARVSYDRLRRCSEYLEVELLCMLKSVERCRQWRLALDEFDAVSNRISRRHSGRRRNSSTMKVNTVTLCVKYFAQLVLFSILCAHDARITKWCRLINTLWTRTPLAEGLRLGARIPEWTIPFPWSLVNSEFLNYIRISDY